MGKEDYLARVEKVEKRRNFKQARQIYKEKKDNYRPGDKDDLSRSANAYLESSFPDTEILSKRADIQAVANELMKRDTLYSSIKGANLYEKLGKGNQAIPRLLNALERSKFPSAENVEEVREFVERNANKREERKAGLESRMVISGILMLGGIALSASSLNATGNIISSSAGNPQGILGVLFFVSGLAGMFLLRKR